MAIFEGSAVALVLPMHEDGSIDYDGFKRQVQRMIDGGVQAILVNGTTGETPTIHIDEEFELTKIVMEMTKGTGIKVIAGAGSNDTETALKNRNLWNRMASTKCAFGPQSSPTPSKPATGCVLPLPPAQTILCFQTVIRKMVSTAK